jgi:hypothetical protein
VRKPALVSVLGVSEFRKLLARRKCYDLRVVQAMLQLSCQDSVIPDSPAGVLEKDSVKSKKAQGPWLFSFLIGKVSQALYRYQNFAFEATTCGCLEAPPSTPSTTASTLLSDPYVSETLVKLESRLRALVLFPDTTTISESDEAWSS